MHHRDVYSAVISSGSTDRFPGPRSRLRSEGLSAYDVRHAAPARFSGVRFFLGVLFSVVSFLAPVMAQDTMITNDTVIEFSTAGLSNAAIISAIQSGIVTFDLSPADLVALRNAGIRNPVIESMLDAAPALSSNRLQRSADTPSTYADLQSALDREAIEMVRNDIERKGLLIFCNGHSYRYYDYGDFRGKEDDWIAEVQGGEYIAYPEDLSAADKLNGVVWRGGVNYKITAQRFYPIQPAPKDEWKVDRDSGWTEWTNADFLDAYVAKKGQGGWNLQSLYETSRRRTSCDEVSRVASSPQHVKREQQLAPPKPEAQSKAAKAAYFAGNYPEALRLAKPMAESGDAMSQFILGAFYSEGLGGVTKDADQAVNWYRKSAEQGLPEGMTGLGSMYGRGLGVPHDEVEAVKWFRKAAELGEPTAQLNLGVRYESGYGVPQERNLAIEWYRKSAQQGNEQAKEALQKLGAIDSPSAKSGHRIGGNDSTEIGADSVWTPDQGRWEDIHTKCKRDANCITSKMQTIGASPQAISFTNLMKGERYLSLFREMGIVDLGRTTRPVLNDPNVSDYILVNGQPQIIALWDSARHIDIKGNPNYGRLAQRFPNIQIWPMHAFESMQRLPQGGQRFIFDFVLLNGCRGCERAGHAKIAFDFDASGAYLNTTLVRLVGCLCQYPVLSQKDPSNYRPHSPLLSAYDTVQGSDRKELVPNLACLATVYTILERGRGNNTMSIDDYYKIGTGAYPRPTYVGEDQDLDLALIKQSLDDERPVILHGEGGPLKHHFVLVVGLYGDEADGQRLDIIDPYPGTDAASPAKKYFILLGSSSDNVLKHPVLPVSFGKMRLIAQ